MVSLSDLSTPSRASKIKVADLKEELTQKGLSTDGLKSDLIDRLKSHLESISEEGKEESPEDTEEQGDAPAAEAAPEEEEEEAEQATNADDDKPSDETPAEASTSTEEEKAGEDSKEEDTSKRPAEDTADTEETAAKVAKTGEATDKSQGAKVVSKAEAFVGGLSKDVTEEDLTKLFETVGEVQIVRLVKDKNTGVSKGFAFVGFASAEIRDEVVKKFDKTDLKGRTIGVNPSLNNNTLYIGLLKRSWTQEEVTQWLKEKYEGVVKFELMIDPNEREKNRGFGFLVFDDHSSAVEAHKSYRDKGLEIEGEKLSMDWAESREEPSEEAMSKVKALYVANLDLGVTEEMMQDAFSKFGEIERIVLSSNMNNSKRKDFAFVNYKEREAALKALEEMHGKALEKFPAKPLDVTLAKPQTKKRNDFGGRGGRRGGRGGRRGGFGGRSSGYFASSGNYGMTGFQQQPTMMGMFQQPMFQTWGYPAQFTQQQFGQQGGYSGQSSWTGYNQNYR